MKTRAWKLALGSLATLALRAVAQAQVPDLLTSFDPGGSSLGVGGALQVTGADTLSAYFNPAGVGYLTKRQFGLVYGNLPKSTTFATGTLAPEGRLISSSGSTGSRDITHAGLAFPMSDLRKSGAGVIALAYTVGGTMNDQEFSSSLTTGTISVNNYHLNREAKTEFFTLAYGKANAAQTMSFGFGINYVRQHTSFAEFGTWSDGSGTFGDPNPVADTGYGVGVTVGLQGVPKDSPNMSWGISYRSPVDLHGNPNTSDVYNRIPGRALAGIAIRNDNLRGGKDYAVFGFQLGYFFSGQSSLFFDRTNQTTGGIGVEYNRVGGGGRIPVRFGFASVPSGGNGFATRNAVTYGIGYRPNDGKYTFDIDGASPQGGGSDLSLSLNYRFEK